METPPSLQRIIDLAQQRGEKVAHIDTIFVPFLTKLIKENYPAANLKVEKTRVEVPTARIVLTFKNQIPKPNGKTNLTN